MGDKSKIEWTDSTWNPVRGCTRVSEGCRNCYAEIMAARFSAPGQWGEGFAAMQGGDHRWSGKVALIESHLDLPLRWKTPRCIFVNSTSDLFHESLPDEAIDRVFAVMALCPQHTFQVLTKRPERMRSYFNGPYPTGDGVYARIAAATFEFIPVKGLSSRSMVAENPVGPILASGEPEFGYRRFLPPRGLPNVWLGTSVEDQERADERIPHLVATPAAVRFLSCEPLLGPIHIDRAFLPRVGHRLNPPPLHWVIVGGESGPGARPMHPSWARHLQAQCDDAAVPFFFKQWGEWAPGGITPMAVGARDCTPGTIETVNPKFALAGLGRSAIMLNCIGKKAAGRLLDGVEHNGFPECAG